MGGSLCDGLPDEANDEDGVLGQPSQSLKLKRNGNTYGTFIARSITVQYMFAARFFKRAPVVRVERGTFLRLPYDVL